MGYLPSKNFIALVFAALVVLFTGWFVSLVWNSATQTPKSAARIASTSFLAAYQDANRDSDNDGLKDWEEILWKTDPNKPDTDGDGVLDAEEIKENRLKSPEQVKPPPAGGPQTLTDRIAKKFAVEYLTTQGASGGNPNDFQKKSLSESLMTSLAKDALTFKDQFEARDVVISKDVSAKSYLNELGAFLDKNFAGLNDPEITILDQALASSDFKKLEALADYVKAYQRAAAFLKKQKVPENYAPSHLELMNILNNTAVAVSYMQATEKDPAKGLIGLSIYFKQVERATNFSKSIRAQIKTDALEFKPAEGGYHFVKYGL